jgi:hypothetical protein
VPPIAGGVLGSIASGIDSPMEISSAAPSSSTWKLNNPKAISKPLVPAETAPVTLEMGSMVVVAEESMANTRVDSTVLRDAVSTMVGVAMLTMVGDVVSTSMSMLMADEVMSMSMADEATSISIVVGDAETTAVVGDEPSTLVDVNRPAMVGEGADESVDPDPIVPTVGAN